MMFMSNKTIYFAGQDLIFVGRIIEFENLTNLTNCVESLKNACKFLNCFIFANHFNHLFY